MSKSKRKKETEEIKEESTTALELYPVKYSNWFSAKLQRNQKLKPHHLNVVFAYFKNRGLSNEESFYKYDNMLKEFGF